MVIIFAAANLQDLLKGAEVLEILIFKMAVISLNVFLHIENTQKV